MVPRAQPRPQVLSVDVHDPGLRTGVVTRQPASARGDARSPALRPTLTIMGKTVGNCVAAVVALIGACVATGSTTASAQGDAFGAYAVAVIAAGTDHTCAIRADATVACWGANSDDQIGIGTAGSTPVTRPTTVAGLRDVRSVAAGDRFTCALKMNGTVACWGRGLEGQLGNGTRASSPVPVVLSSSWLTSVVALSAGGTNACALLADGQVFCWGDHDFPGSFGSGDAEVVNDPRIPARVQVLEATGISVGNRFACVTTRDLSVLCWGRGTSGQLGNGASLSSRTPVKVVGLPQPIPGFNATFTAAVSAGGRHACAFAVCWGDNNRGQLGDGTLTPSNVPVATPVLSGRPLVAGGDLTCMTGRSSNSSFATFCWGDNSFGQLATPSPPDHSTTPILVNESSEPVAVGGDHACSFNRGDLGIPGDYTITFACWGRDDAGQLGNGNVAPSSGVVATGVTSPPAWLRTRGVRTTIEPVRVLDTRPGVFVGYNSTKPGPGGTVPVRVTGATLGVPETAIAVSVNVTGTEATAPGFVTVWPCDQPRPLASTLNLVPGEDRANLALVRIGADGLVCAFTQSGAHLVVDVEGYIDAQVAYAAVAPKRLADRRGGGGALGAFEELGQGSYALSVPAIDGVLPPPDSTMVLNVTATDVAVDGFVTVWPCSEHRPLASNLNVRAGETLPVGVLVRIGTTSPGSLLNPPTGRICFYTNTGANLVVDANGWFPPGGTMSTVAGIRVLDTRPSSRVGYAGFGKPAGTTEVSFDALPLGPQSGRRSIVLSVTATEADAAGFVRVSSCGSSPTGPFSNLNVAAGGTRANLVIAEIASTVPTKLCLFTNVPMHLIVDVDGWTPQSATTVTTPS